MTEEEIHKIESVTGWTFMTNAQGRGRKFVVKTAGRRRQQGEWSSDYYELVLWMQPRLKLSLWVDANRYDWFKKLELGFSGWSVANTEVAWPQARGMRDLGIAIDVKLDVTSQELYSRLGHVIQIVNAVREQLRACGVPF